MNPYNKNDSKSIQKMFGSIAKQYDRTNAFLSLLMHKYWNKKLIEMALFEKEAHSYLDLCCGTGEIALNYLKNCSSPCEAYLLDFCPEMLSLAKERTQKLKSRFHKISFIEADAQNIPFADASIDNMTMAYGIRNIPDPSKCFKEMYRVLNNQGKVGILELTQPRNVILKTGHSLYLKTMLPLIGKLVASNGDAYQYLCNSIKSFTQPKELEEMLKSVGFKNITIIPLMGGIATLFSAQKI